jgi:hypothetical protein
MKVYLAGASAVAFSFAAPAMEFDQRVVTAETRLTSGRQTIDVVRAGLSH